MKMIAATITMPKKMPARLVILLYFTPASGLNSNVVTTGPASINPDTGKLAWYYQSTPHDAWDYDGVNELLLADVKIGGADTPVLMKADRNGFFFVANREIGKMISAEK